MDNPAATPIPHRRWNRRRGFYLAVAAASLGLMGWGWSWWYREHFPMPTVPGAAVGGIDVGFWNAWCSSIGGSLTDWKIRRETRQLGLEQSEWVDSSNGIRIRFGGDHRIWIELSPDVEDNLDGMVRHYRDQFEVVGRALNGQTYRFDPFVAVSSNSFFSYGRDRNLAVGESPWPILIMFNGKNFLFGVWNGDGPMKSPPAAIYLTRVTDP